METTLEQKFPLQRPEYKWKLLSNTNISRVHIYHYRTAALLALSVLLLSCGILVYLQQINAYAASTITDQSCPCYQIQPGDTLTKIAINHHTTVQVLAQTNHLTNVNLIITGRRLSLPQHSTQTTVCTHYMASRQISTGLQFSSQSQVAIQLSGVAHKYNLPVSLLYAIAWQESGWNQRALARDGGLGVMQLMPATARGLNVMAGTRLNPYLLQDNIELGALYLHTLWINFHGNLPQVISAYNEGGWNVVHRGIFNWRYVNSVLALMRKYQ